MMSSGISEEKSSHVPSGKSNADGRQAPRISFEQAAQGETSGAAASAKQTCVIELEREQRSDSIRYWHYKQTGIRSRPIKPLRHPIEQIERKIIITYLFGLILKLIAILSGPLIVLPVHMLTLPVTISRQLVWSVLNIKCAFNARVKTSENVARDSCKGASKQQLNWNYCPLDFLENYWFQEKLVTTSILVLKNRFVRKSGAKFDIITLRQVFTRSVLAKPEFRKFLCRVEKKGIPFYKGLYWHYLGLLQGQDDGSPSTNQNIPDPPLQERSISVATLNSSSSISESSTGYQEDVYDVCVSLPTEAIKEEPEKIDLRRHIYLDQVASGERNSLNLSTVRRHAHGLLELALDTSRPLWEIRVLPSKSKGRTYIIFRTHQSLVDGRSLVKMLGEYLAEKQEHKQTNSPRIESDLDWTNLRVQDSELKPIRDRESFVSKIGRSSGFRSAIFVGPLTVLFWSIWAMTRRKHNHLNRCSPDSKQASASSGALQSNCFNSRRFSMTRYSLTKFYQIKQMTRSTVNDIVLCALSGALRNYLSRYNAISNPPDLNVSLTLDMRQTGRPSSESSQSEKSIDESIGVNTTVLNAPLPTSVEGAVPRLWELRNSMAELRSSADPWVMVGLQRYLHLLLPAPAYRWLVNRLALRNTSALVSNIRGPANAVESWCVDLAKRALQESQQAPRTVQGDYVDEECKRPSGKGLAKLSLQADLGRLSAVYYCVQPPTDAIPISFNCITYHNKIFITSLSRSVLVEDSKLLLELFVRQLDQLASTIGKRRPLITYVQSPRAFELSPEPGSPKTQLDFARVLSQRSGLDQLIGALPADEPERTDALPKARRGSMGIIECLGSSSLGAGHRDKCQACHSQLCFCRRRKSLFAMDSSSQRSGSLLGLFNPGGQKISLRRARTDALAGNHELKPAIDEHFL